MKKIITLSIATICFAIISFSQNEKFMAAMGSTLSQYGAAKTVEELTTVAAKFERIGDAEKTQWLPYYYAALIKARMSMEGMGGDKDKVADEAAILINKASEIDKANSEIFCIKIMIAQAKMLVDPMNRWIQYGSEANANIEAAKKADATNPRPYFLQSISLKNTPEQFGGGCATAKPLAEKAAKLYADFKLASPLHPTWGKENVDEIIKSCN